MHPYYLREKRESGRNSLEIVVGIVAIGLLAACVLADLPRVDSPTSAQRSRDYQQHGQSIAALEATIRTLQTKNEAADVQLAKIAQLLESTRADLINLIDGHSSLSTQVVAATTRLQELETTVQETNEHATKLSEFISMHQLLEERDAAISESKRSGDQVRDLTLRLQRAGVYP
ncbi:MAG: hypothetical protein A2Y77_04560 [Planctomycetes bacterium RBG_13_62_9]|nr:MAG: hypothetical protein A2Y77_04560 [Planctomycetes bacterium RBG_13_62_9]